MEDLSPQSPTHGFSEGRKLVAMVRDPPPISLPLLSAAYTVHVCTYIHLNMWHVCVCVWVLVCIYVVLGEGAIKVYGSKFLIDFTLVACMHTQSRCTPKNSKCEC